MRWGGGVERKQLRPSTFTNCDLSSLTVRKTTDARRDDKYQEIPFCHEVDLGGGLPLRRWLADPFLNGMRSPYFIHLRARSGDGHTLHQQCMGHEHNVGGSDASF